jgi:mono/diheme cytochrome c family protein
MLRHSVVLPFALALALPAVGFGDDAKVAKGKEIYAAQKCQMCHSIGGTVGKKTPLDGVGSKFDAATIKKWIVAPKEMKPDIKKPDFSKKIMGDDLDALVAYLETLKK